jgi:hypothetical protein
VLVTNQGFPEGSPSTWAVLDVFAGEPGLPLFRPFVLAPLPRTARLPRLGLTVEPKHAPVGRVTSFHFAVALRGKPVAGAVVHFTGRSATTGPAGRATLTFAPRRRGPRKPIATRRGALPAAAHAYFDPR